MAFWLAFKMQMYQECAGFPSNDTKKELGIVLNKFVSLILLLSDEKD